MPPLLVSSLALLLLAHVVLAAATAAPPPASGITSPINAAATTTAHLQRSIPIIDIAPLISPTSSLSKRQRVADQIGAACSDIGFFAIVNHGIPPATIEALLASSRKFFDMAEQDKMAAKSANDAEYPYGYERSEVLSKGKELDWNVGREDECSSAPDLKETFSLGPRLSPDGQLARRWPPKLPPNDKFISTHEEYYAAMERLAQSLLRGFALALGLDEDYFRPFFADDHQCALRTLNYPDTGRNLRPGQIRAGAHTDYGAVTILKTGGPGLQVRRDVAQQDQGKEGWIDAPDLDDAFIVNVGDMMRRWTNDKWASTLHRVVGMSDTDITGAADDRRQSIAFFVNARWDAVVEPLSTCVSEENPAKYEPVTAGEYLIRKHLASMGSDLDEASS